MRAVWLWGDATCPRPHTVESWGGLGRLAHRHRGQFLQGAGDSPRLR
ncbi:MAG: hypothetical protein KME26_17845 [Oscillatoria princeps RMCB-10]|nr:hypothetical protein [Oscillatoria princeps RMCB-10]